jgi:hypothetical protein
MFNDGLGNLDRAARMLVHDETRGRRSFCPSAISPSWERRRLRNEVSIAIVVKLLAIFALMLAFSAPSGRPHISAQSMFQAEAPFGATAKGDARP